MHTCTLRLNDLGANRIGPGRVRRLTEKYVTRGLICMAHECRQFDEIRSDSRSLSVDWMMTFVTAGNCRSVAFFLAFVRASERDRPTAQANSSVSTHAHVSSSSPDQLSASVPATDRPPLRPKCLFLPSPICLLVRSILLPPAPPPPPLPTIIRVSSLDSLYPTLAPLFKLFFLYSFICLSLILTQPGLAYHSTSLPAAAVVSQEFFSPCSATLCSCEENN